MGARDGGLDPYGGVAGGVDGVEVPRPARASDAGDVGQPDLVAELLQGVGSPAGKFEGLDCSSSCCTVAPGLSPGARPCGRAGAELCEEARAVAAKKEGPVDSLSPGAVAADAGAEAEERTSELGTGLATATVVARLVKDPDALVSRCTPTTASSTALLRAIVGFMRWPPLRRRTIRCRSARPRPPCLAGVL